MEPKRWPVVVVTIVLLLLIYNFLSTIFKSNIKRFSHDRIYVDYATYKKSPKGTAETPYRSTSGISHQMALAERHMDTDRVEAAMAAFDQGMALSLSKRKLPKGDAPLRDEAYEEAKRLAAINHPEIAMGNALYAAGKFDQALSKFNEILSDLPEKDLQNRMKLYDSMSECYFRLKNKDGYVQYKTKFVQAQKELRDMIRRVYPRSAPPETPLWITSEEAMTHLLRVKTLAIQHLQEENRDMLIRRAEYDLEVARQLSG